jgi:hypothetical protein
MTLIEYDDHRIQNENSVEYKDCAIARIYICCESDVYDMQNSYF